jgi:hypothetical protein
MVKQDICGVIKYDTVVVHASALGLGSVSGVENSLKLFPNPASDVLNIELMVVGSVETTTVKIYNSFGQLIREEERIFKDKKAVIDTKELANGVYLISLLQAQGTNLQTVSKRFVIAR